MVQNLYSLNSISEFLLRLDLEIERAIRTDGKVCVLLLKFPKMSVKVDRKIAHLLRRYDLLAKLDECTYALAFYIVNEGKPFNKKKILKRICEELGVENLRCSYKIAPYEGMKAEKLILSGLRELSLCCDRVSGERNVE